MSWDGRVMKKAMELLEWFRENDHLSVAEQAARLGLSYGYVTVLRSALIRRGLLRPRRRGPRRGEARERGAVERLAAKLRELGLARPEEAMAAAGVGSSTLGRALAERRVRKLRLSPKRSRAAELLRGLTFLYADPRAAARELLRILGPAALEHFDLPPDVRGALGEVGG